MKKLIVCCIINLIPSLLFGQQNQHYFWYKGDKKVLNEIEDKRYLLFDSKPDRVQLSKSLQVDINQVGEFVKVSIENSTLNDTYWSVVEGKILDSKINLPGLLYSSPFYYTNEGDEAGLSHLFYVKLKNHKDKVYLESLAEANNVEILHQNKFRPLWYTLACTSFSTRNALEVANLFYESGLFAAAEPDLMPISLTQSVNDPFYSDQWNLQNTGQYNGTFGSDIKIIDAWEITHSHSGIVLAVIDHGIEMNHPDLPNMYTLSYDTYSGTSPSTFRSTVNHATPVAGIAGANIDNNEGIAGIAPKGQLMSISNSLFTYPGIKEDLADGIDYAWGNGAHIINNSWGGSPLIGQVIDDAIDNAVNQGRGGLGTVVVFSSGNENKSSIDYPSSNVDVLAIGASSMCDERASLTSCDTEDWGSNYGNGIDLVAPGVLIPTTDRQGNISYNDKAPLHPDYGGTLILNDYSNKDYTIWFNGTSAAAPHVSGIASLILSINNTLTVQQVRNAIESSAEKVGNYTYGIGLGEQSGLTWNNEMGYGRVNAYEALIYTIENYGAHVGDEKSQVTILLKSNLSLQEDITLESGSNLTIEPLGTITISSANGSVTIGGTGSSAKSIGDGGNDNIQNDEEKDSNAGLPKNYSLSDNYPNPFNPTTVIKYELPESGMVELLVFDLLGRKVATLVDEYVTKGKHQIVFEASNLSSGIYIYRLKVGDFLQTKKMTLIK